jgi:hypothetical protein
MLFTVSSTGRHYRKPYSAELYKKNPRNKKTWHFEEQKNEDRKPDNFWSLRRLKFMPRNLH